MHWEISMETGMSFETKKNICFVVQRYGNEVVGGAESLCMQYAQELKRYFCIDVVTSCAIDYDTWENYYQEGQTEMDGVTVYRYHSVHPRRNELIGPLTEAVYSNPDNSLRLGKKWLKEVGPYCPGIIRHIKKYKKHYDVFIFVGYHYYNSTFGMPCVPGKAIFLPTAHDEPPLRNCNYFKILFSMPRAFLFLSEEERDFVLQFFHIPSSTPSVVTGLWIETPKIAAGYAESVKQKYKIAERYVMYTGRMDDTKNCSSMFENFMTYKEKCQNNIQLVLAGKAKMQIPQREDIRYIGFVDEAEKMHLLAGALGFIMPSGHESLSISTLEAMACGTPILAYGGSEVIKKHIEKSGSGFIYYNAEDFTEKMDFLINKKQIRDEMGTSGRKYVSENYNRHDIINKLATFIYDMCERKHVV